MRTRAPLLTLLTLFSAPALSSCESVAGPEAEKGALTELPRSLSGSEQGVIRASNRFAFGLLREVARDTGSNHFISPLSASMALGMTMNGARGETFEGMRSALGFEGMQRGEIAASYRSLTELLLGLDSAVDLRIANAIWVEQQFPLHEAFVRSSRDDFLAEVTRLDFRDPRTVGTINGWVDRSTAGKIKDIIDRIDPDVVMYLMNATYFKGSWTRQFDTKRTRDAQFTRADGSRQTVRMMHLPYARIRHHADAKVEVADIPYGREAFSMTVLLPSRNSSIRELVAGLDGRTWDGWMQQLAPRELDVFLPRFRLEYERVLNEQLQALGMERAFDPYGADFGNISPLGEDLYISQVKQKTFVEVNEEGTEAAAVTSVEVRPVSMPPSFHVDRPFLVAIRERLSGTILFLGVIGAPPPAR